MKLKNLCCYKTVIVHSFVTPSIDARIFVVPRFIAVTFPRLVTVATLFFCDFHVTFFPEDTFAVRRSV